MNFKNLTKLKNKTKVELPLIKHQQDEYKSNIFPQCKKDSPLETCLTSQTQKQQQPAIPLIIDTYFRKQSSQKETQNSSSERRFINHFPTVVQIQSHSSQQDADIGIGDRQDIESQVSSRNIVESMLMWKRKNQRLKEMSGGILDESYSVLRSTQRLINQLNDKKDYDSDCMVVENESEESVEFIYPIFDPKKLLNGMLKLMNPNLLPEQKRDKCLTYRQPPLPNKPVQEALKFGSKGLFSNYLHINEHLELDFGQGEPELLFNLSQKQDTASILKRYPQLIKSHQLLDEEIQKNTQLKKKVICFSQKYKNSMDGDKLQIIDQQYQDNLFCLSSNLQFQNCCLQSTGVSKHQHYQQFGKRQQILSRSEQLFNVEEQNIDEVLEPTKIRIISFMQPQYYLDINLLDKPQRESQLSHFELFPFTDNLI